MGSLFSRESGESGGNKRSRDEVDSQSDHSDATLTQGSQTSPALGKKGRPLRHLLIRNARVWQWTSEPLKTTSIAGEALPNHWVEVNHLGRIINISSSTPPEDDLFTMVVDARDHLLIPGLMDAHIHVMMTGEAAYYLNFKGCKSIAEMKELLAKHRRANPDLSCIIGTSWDQDQLGAYPSRYDIDEVVADIPVFLWRACWHIGVANTTALTQAGVDLTKHEFPMHGGKIDADSRGPTGIVREQATAMITATIAAKHSDENKRKFIEQGLRQCSWFGLTGVRTNDAEAVHIYAALQAENALPLRAFVTPVHSELDNDKLAPISAHLDSTASAANTSASKLQSTALKIFADGSLGAETAALHVTTDESTNNPTATDFSGVLTHNSVEELAGKIIAARDRGFGIEIHAIGDAAANQVMSAFIEAKIRPSERAMMTHCQVLNDDIIGNMEQWDVIASVQPSFVPTDMLWAERRLRQQQLDYSYAWKTLLQRGVVVAGGSDSPIETSSPLVGLFDAIYREDRLTGEVFRPTEKLSFAEALWTYTVGAAISMSSEASLGQIKPDFAADFVLLDAAVLSDNRLLQTTSPRMVFVGGDVTYHNVDVEDGPCITVGAAPASAYSAMLGEESLVDGPFVPGKNGSFESLGLPRGAGFCACWLNGRQCHMKLMDNDDTPVLCLPVAN